MPHDRNPDTPQAGLDCEGEHCVYHNPSEHHMRDWPIIRGGERVCEHGVGHPDPDYLAWRDRAVGGQGVAGAHGCDLCCVPPGHTITLQVSRDALPKPGPDAPRMTIEHNLDADGDSVSLPRDMG